MNGTSCWGVTLAEGSVTHIHADRVWIDGDHLVFSEERDNPDAAQPGEAPTCHYQTVIFAGGQWRWAFAASIVDGSPLPVIEFPTCAGAMQPADERR